MFNRPKRFCAGGLVIAAVLMLACNREPRAALVLDEPLRGATTGTRSGGAFVASGWKVTGKNDYICWHVPTLTNGAVEWSVKGLAPRECRPGMEDKTELFHMYDYTWNNSDSNYAPGYRDNPYKHFVRKTGCLDAARVDAMEILWLIGPNYLEGDSPVLAWDTNRTYLFRQEWKPDGAGGSTLRTYRDGTLILTQTVPGLYAPTGHSVRIGASTRRAADAGAPIGAVFSDLKVWNSTRRIPGAPTIIQPASGQFLNTPVIFVQWRGDPHRRYQVRLNGTDAPDSAIVWDSGEVNSDRDFAWTGPLPNQNTYYVYARLGNVDGWGAWSGSGRTVKLDLSMAPGGANLARLAGKSFCDNHGPFLALGASYFQALRRAKYDRARLERDLELLASKGFNYVRVLSMVNWDGLEIAPVSFTNSAGHYVAAWPDYWRQFRDLLDAISRHGLRAAVTVFADAQHIMPGKPVRQAHLGSLLANIAGREDRILHLEVANEAWQNGFPGSSGVADLREFTQYLADRTSLPVAITSNSDTSDQGLVSLYSGSAADLATVHFTRDINTPEGGWLPVRDCYRAGYLPGVPPVSSNEPIGPGSSVNSENDPLRLCAAAVFAYIANLPAYVYHSRAGVYGDARFEDTAGTSAYQWVRRVLPPDLASWVRNDGLEPAAPFTAFCNGQANCHWDQLAGPTNGCYRNIGSAKGREFVCFPMGILQGGVTLQARRPLQFHLIHPLTGAVSTNLTQAAGSQFALPQGPGAYIIRGQFLDVGTPLVPRGAVWRYLDDGSDQRTAWRGRGFDDSIWPSGSAQLGYGDDDEATLVSYGLIATNKHITTYFRHAFPCAEPASFTNLALRVLRDDGAVVYLNGFEVFRSNMPTGLVTHLIFAESVVSGADEDAFVSTNLSPKRLVKGTNLLAAEVHQANRDSTDMSFDLELSGEAPAPPPPQLTVARSGSQLAIGWPGWAVDFRLQSALNVDLPADWGDASLPVVSSDGFNWVAESALTERRFYRLRRW
jgi:hypothetical protein